MILISTTHDTNGLFIPLIERLADKLQPYMHNAVIACTSVTIQETKDALQNAGFTVIEGGSFNQGRIAGLKKAMELDPENEFTMSVCLDKLLHWLEFEPEEFDRMFHRRPQSDLELLGRTEKAWTTYPRSWERTEMIVNDLFSKRIGKQMDALTGDLLISRNAAGIVCEQSVEPHAGACVEWPLLALQEGLSVDCIKVDGLSWEDADRSAKAIEAAGGYNAWKESIYEGLSEWKKRSQFQVDMIATLERFTK
jgi:hypothetical protein